MTKSRLTDEKIVGILNEDSMVTVETRMKNYCGDRVIFSVFISLWIFMITMGFRSVIANEIGETLVYVEKLKYQTIEDIPTSALKQLATKKIYFGHHSVGGNIINGIEDLMKEYQGLDINIIRTTNDVDFAAGGFAHSRVGENTKPKSKIEDFANYIDNGIGNSADLAGFKFCFVDIQLDTDVDELLNAYSQSVEAIKAKFPELIIIHFTIPLTEQKTTWKHYIKSILRIDDPWRFGPNINRNIFNEKLTEKYGDTDFIFDIAAIESTYPDGARSTFEVNGIRYFSLAPEYTSDGGHLNEIGRKWVAEKFILFLASI